MKTFFEESWENWKNKVNLWDNARFLLADVPLDKKRASDALPLGMWPTNPPMATLFIASYPKTSFTVPYREAAMLIHVRTLLGKGIHCTWMIVDDDTALIYGRELLGYPKKMGTFTFNEEGNKISASVTRRGITVLEMKGERMDKEVKPSPVFDRKMFNASGMGQFFTLNPVWLLRAKEKIHESYAAKVSLSVKESEFDPIASMISGPPENGRVVVMDILYGRYLIPVGFAGPFWLNKNFRIRFR